MFIRARYTNPKSRITKQNGGLSPNSWVVQSVLGISPLVYHLYTHQRVGPLSHCDDEKPSKHVYSMLRIIYLAKWFPIHWVFQSFFLGKTMLISPMDGTTADPVQHKTSTVKMVKTHLRCGRWRTSCTSYGRASLQRAGFKLWYLVINLIVNP